MLTLFHSSLATVLLATALPDTVVREAYVMGTVLRIKVEAASDVEAFRSAEAVLAEVERLDGLLSTWDPASEMSRLNRATPGTPTAMNAEVAALLFEVEEWTRETGRAFDPAVGALVDAWDLRGAGRIPGPDELDAVSRATGSRGMAIDRRDTTSTRRDARAWIDTGAFGKGAALRSARRILAGSGASRAFLDLGGQALVWSRGVSAPTPRSVWVAHPDQRSTATIRLDLDGVSVATSGTSERFVDVGGRRLGHILDPRTGFPAPAWGSVTVVHADPMVADVLATALYVMGPVEGLAWAEKRGTAALFLLETAGDIEPSWTTSMEAWLGPATIPSTQWQ